MTPDQAREELAAWKANSDRRDPLVLASLAAGLEKTEVHKLTGIARTTIDRIERQERDMQDSTVTWHGRQTDLRELRERQDANRRAVQAALDELHAGRKTLKARYATDANMTNGQWNDPALYAQYCEAAGRLNAEYSATVHDVLEEYHMARVTSEGGWVPLQGGHGCYLEAMGGRPWGRI